MAKKKAQSDREHLSQASDESGGEADSGTDSVETAMAELAAIVTQLESGQGSLDDSLLQFERGMSLLRLCHRRLDHAAQRIEIVTRLAEGQELQTRDFDSTATFARSQTAAPAEPGGAHPAAGVNPTEIRSTEVGPGEVGPAAADDAKRRLF